MCLRWQTCRINHHMIQLNTNVHGTGRKGLFLIFYLLWESPDARSRELSIALNHKETSPIMAVTVTILPKGYANVITRHEQNKNILSHVKSVGNKQKQKEDIKDFVISNIVSIVSSPSKKTDQNEVNAIQDLLQCSRSSSYRQQKIAYTKRGHVIAQVKIQQWNGLSSHTLSKQKKIARH